MRIYTRYKQMRRKNRSGPDRALILCIVIVIGLIVAGWIWRKQIAQEEAAARANPPRHTNVPPVKPALPVQVVRSNPPPVVITRPPVGTNPAKPGYPRPAKGGLEVQVALARRGFSPGSLDGSHGSQTRTALIAFQKHENLPATGESDEITRAHLQVETPVMTTYTVTSNDLARLLPIGTNWVAKAQQPRLDYETILELVSEKSRAHPAMIRRLNPGVVWTNVTEGTTLQILDIAPPQSREKAAFIRIQLAARALDVFDATTNLIAHFPCSIAQRVEKRPAGELHVKTIAPNPNYLFDPANFPESAEARALTQKMMIPPGPNNPVGTAWIGLDKPGYGIHGTPKPEDVGRTESHGCFRLANWNAEQLVLMCWTGMPVIVEP